MKLTLKIHSSDPVFSPIKKTFEIESIFFQFNALSKNKYDTHIEKENA